MLLAERIKAVECRYAAATGSPGPGRKPDHVAIGHPEIDAALQGGLLRGALHEWLGIARSDIPEGTRGQSWTPPVATLVHLAWRFLETAPAARHVVWIGERCFPYPRVLVRGDDRRLLDGSLFLTPRNAGDRLWAVDTALRSPAVGLVIADGSRFDMAATRRIQLAAKSRGTPALLVRPPEERAGLSAAQTRWLLRWAAASRNTSGPRWSVELLRCKGVQPDETRRLWVWEWDRAACTLDPSAPLVNSQSAAQAPVGNAARGDIRQRSA